MKFKTFIQNIFSVKNENNRKVLTVLGIKIKTKCLKTRLNVRKENEINFKKKFYHKKSCYLCNSNELEFIDLNPDFKNSYVVRCQKCGFMFNVFDKLNIDNYYKEEYRNERSEHITQNYIDIQDKRAQVQFDFIKSNIDKSLENMKILEIGCSVARLLKKFETRNNILIGYEADIEMAKWAENNINGTIINSMCDINKLPNNSYDLIMLSHVFEHFDNPLTSLKLLLDALKFGGYIFIEIPGENLESVKFMCSNQRGVGHYTYFSFKNIQSLIKKFPEAELIKLETYTMNIDNYISKLKNNESFVFDMSKKIEDNSGIHIRCLLKKRELKND